MLQQIRQGKDIAQIQAAFPIFSESGLTVNRVLSVNPLLLGYFDEKMRLNINDRFVRAVSLIAKLRGLNVYVSPPEVRIVKDGTVYGVLREDGFAAGDALLFQEIALKVYGLGGSATIEAPVKDSWLNSLSRLLSDRELVKTVSLIILVALLPLILTALSLLVMPSHLVPDPIRIGAAIAVLLVASYVARLYIRENLTRRRR